MDQAKFNQLAFFIDPQDQQQRRFFVMYSEIEKQRDVTNKAKQSSVLDYCAIF